MKKIIILILGFLILTNFNLNAYMYTETEAKEGINLVRDFGFNNGDNKYKINDLVYKDNYILIVGSIELTNPTPTPAYYNSYPFIALYKDFEIMFLTVVKSYGYGEFTSGLFEDDSLVVLGGFEGLKKVSCMQFIKYDFEGVVLNRFYKLTNGDTYSNKIFKSGTKYFITGVTRATDLTEQKIPNHLGIMFVCCVNSNFKIEKVAYFGNEGVNSISDSIIGDGIIYIYGKTSSGTDYLVKNSGLILISLDLNLDRLNYLTFETVHIHTLTYAFGKVIFTTYFVLTKNLVTYVYNPYLALISKTEQITSNLYIDMDYYYNKTNNTLLTMNTMYVGEEKYLKVSFLNESFEKIYQTSFETTKNYTKVLYLDEVVFLYGVSSDRKIILDKLMYIILKEEKCFINGVEAISTYQEKEGVDFGYYKSVVGFKINNDTINIELNVYIKPKVSVSDNGVYDLNHVLTFNGTGLLNNQEIESGYVLSEAGLYFLEVKGNTESVFYTFTIDDLCLVLEDRVIDSYLIIEEIREYNDYEEISSIEYKNVSIKEEEKDIIPTLMLFVLIGLIIGFFIPVRGKKNV